MPSCIVSEVRSGTAAEAADIHVGDEIISCDGKPVHNFEEFTAFVATKKGGDAMKVELRREDRVINKEVTLGKLTADVVGSGRFVPKVINPPMMLPIAPAVPPQK